MTKAEQIAQILGVKSTYVIVENGESARLKDRELTEEEKSQIEHVFESEDVKKLRQEFDQKLEQRVNQIAEAVASGARGQELADKMRKK